ncbi:MAG: hypothetical protein ABIK36_17810 [Pseudomonadota bacterium]
MTESLPGTPILILGMHRSGTSCLAGCLQAAGLFLAEVKTHSTHNKKGNRENIAVMHLNDEVLASNGGSWRNPPASVVWSGSQLAKGKQVAKAIAWEGPWGFKDPRTLPTLDGWVSILGKVEIAASCRHPLAVAQSLNRRDPTLSIDEGLQLWQAYNERLVGVAARLPIRLIDYDRSGETYLDAVVRIARDLALPEPEAAARFYDDDLRHQAIDEARSIPPSLAHTYARLQELVW